jgi:hypothetical protein
MWRDGTLRDAHIAQRMVFPDAVSWDCFFRANPQWTKFPLK